MTTTVRKAFEYHEAQPNVTPASLSNSIKTRKHVEASGLMDREVYTITTAVLRQFIADVRTKNPTMKDSSLWLYSMKFVAVLRAFVDDHNLPITLSIKQVMRSPRPKSMENGELQYFTLDRVKQLFMGEVPPELELGRNLFVVMCLTGMSVSDVLKFDPAVNIKGDWLQYSRTKRGHSCKVPVLPIAREWIGRVNWPVQLATRTVQQYCTKLGKHVGEHIHPHKARHTFGCIALEVGFSMESVSRMLGHTSIRTTEQYYAKVSEAKIQREMDQMNEASKQAIQ